MNIRSLKRGNLQRYSFKDLEYGLKLIQGEIDDLKHMIKTIKKLQNHEVLKDTYIEKGMIDTTEKEIKKYDTIVKLVQDEIANRLLTGNDDGVVIKELLGAN